MSFWERLITPFAMERTKVRWPTLREGQFAFIGYLKIYVFGIRIAKIQLTNPW
jgi:hypothetical protein